MPEGFHIIQLLVAPVVMISACGLLCLALYNRLAAIVSRARTFHKERFEVTGKLTAAEANPEDSVLAQQLRNRVETLDDQVSQILRRAVLIRNALVCLLVAILCMLGCSVSLGLSSLNAMFGYLALLMFSLGVLVMMAAMALAIVELLRALDPVALEHENIEDLMYG